MTQERESLLEVAGLTVRYRLQVGEFVGAREVDLTVRAGELMAIVGESGSGKSSTAYGILRLLPGNAHSTGAVRVRCDSQLIDVAQLSARQMRPWRGKAITYIPQATTGALHPARRVQHQFATVLRAHGIARSDRSAQTVRALGDAGITDPERVMRSYPHELSGGLAQRVVIALAQVLEPTVLIADEPTSALDVRVQRQVLDTLSTSVRARKAGAVLITHDLGIAIDYCDSVGVMFAGQLVEQGPAADVLREPAHPYTQRLLAASRGERPVPLKPDLLLQASGDWHHVGSEHRVRRAG